MCPGVGGPEGSETGELVYPQVYHTIFSRPHGGRNQEDLPRRQWTGAGPQEYLRSKLRAEILADRLHLVDVIGLEGGN